MIARTTSSPMEVQKLVFKLSRLMREARFLVSFYSMAENPYLNGEMYCAQEIHLGMLSRFLKYPDKTMKGIKTRGITAPTDFSSSIIHPRRRPSEFPQKAMRMPIK